MPVENSSSTTTPASASRPSDVAEANHHVLTPQSLSPSTMDVPEEYFHNTFPKNGTCCNSDSKDEHKEEGQPGVTYSAQTTHCLPAPRSRPASIEELLITQQSTPLEQRTFYLDKQSNRDYSAASMHAEVKPSEKKRQRRFTTRTKTGCFTCRKRKKKCDEAKPICYNCERGNYHCAGYPVPSARGKNTTMIRPLRDDFSNGDFEKPRGDVLHPITRSIATNPRVVAQMALSHVAAEQNSSLNTEPISQKRSTEKEKMLAGYEYYHFDRELSRERDRAATSCGLFNTVVRTGVSIEEHTRHFLDTIRVVELASTSQLPDYRDVHSVSSTVAVEAPFHCDYGYNIILGMNVTIRRNCAFNDAGRIHIGDNSVIGPSVSIYTEERSSDPRYRQTCRSMQSSKGVIIDSDCWIGGNVTVMPGRIIGKGATVMAGSVVAEDVPPFVVAAGNPARVMYSVAPL